MIHAARALLPDGWVHGVRVTAREGRIVATAPGPAHPGDVRVDTLLPALPNLHSHTFQRAMAGLTEVRAERRESFWTWRDLMYRFLDRLTPEDVEAIAAMAFVEMQEAGFGAVAEFHYLHHQAGGAPFARLAEMSDRIMAAAATTGIGLTHLPVLYAYGGAGRAALQGGQRRFGNDAGRFARLVDEVRAAAAHMPSDTVIGIAPHSLRAIAPDDLTAVLPLAESSPIHLHIAEQPVEVEQVSAWLGARPVDWLLANAQVGPRWCAIHATHMTDDEAARLARTGAVAGLCPVTEANLGDGPFGGPRWLAAGGVFGVGTDSNVRISATDELRMLEYSQRLATLTRNALVPGAGSSGAFLWQAAARGGAQALGRQTGAIAPGLWADLVAVDTSGPALAPVPEARLLDALVFAAPEAVVTDLWSAGRHCVRGGRHLARERVARDYVRVIRHLSSDV